MNVTKKETDVLTYEINVSIQKEDYLSKVEEDLKKLRKNVEMPGFRKGKVPMGMIRKQYEKGTIVNEVNQLMQEALNDFIQKENMRLLGDVEYLEDKDDWNWKDGSFSFFFEVGTSPEIKVDLDTKDRVVLYEVQLEDKDVEEDIKKILKENGGSRDAEEVSEKSIIRGKVIFEKAGEKVEYDAVLDVDNIKSAKAKKALLKKKAGDEVNLSSKGLFKDEHDLMHLLRLSHDEVHGFDNEFTLKIQEVEENIPAEMNQELFDKLFGEGEVKTEEEFRERIREIINNYYKDNAKYLFFNDMKDYLVKNTKFDLPEKFLTRWIVSNQEEEEQIDDEKAKQLYAESEDAFRLQLIFSELAKEFDIKISHGELLDYSMNNIIGFYNQYNMPLPNEETLRNLAFQFISKEEEKNKLEAQLLDQKIQELLLEKAQYKTLPVKVDEFIEKLHQ